MSLIKRAIDAPIDAFARWAKSFNPYVPEDLDHKDGIEPVRIEESSVKKQSSKVIFVAFVAFLVWAFTAPLDSGAVVGGTVVVQGSRKAVQHPKGGVVDKILVKEGDTVRQGDVLVQINPLNIDANLRQAEYEFIQTLAAHSRLLTERAGAPTITWDADLDAFANLIDKVRVGLTTDMRFSAFNKITTPVVPGRVRLVGADRLPPAPPRMPEEHFLVQIETTAEGQALLGQHQIVAGMPVEVVIKGGERSFMSYMLKPLADRFARSFKE